MLTELRIRNFALIDELSVRLGPGLNVLTGETGAGKSIIVGALSLLLGERASSDVVRTGAERATVEGVFETEGRTDVGSWLEERGIDADDGVLILKREVAVEGRNRAWINGAPVTAGLLGELGRILVDLHGQHEHQTLLRRDEQRSILDAYGGSAPLASQVAEAHAHLRDLRHQLQELVRKRADVAERADLLRFQAEEIEAAALSIGEDEALEEEESRLSHSEELLSLTARLNQALSAEDDSLVARTAALRRSLDHLVRIDRSQTELIELLDTAYYALDELTSRLADYAESVEHDPSRLEQIRARRDLIYRLKAKYGNSVEAVVETGRAARASLELIDNADWEMRALQGREKEASEELARLATQLSERRATALQSLAEEVNGILPELGMGGGRFVVEATPLPAPGPSGQEEIEFRITLNAGFPPKPLSAVASGGELSRVMLALKTILAKLDSVPTLVFDEVDSGVGGRVALKVGDKMRQVAGSHQVFAITHLPQIASRAHSHLLVEKLEANGATSTRVALLEDEARVREVARMLGGDPESEVSLEHARELLGGVVRK